ncbi:tetratricopeptide repeat protein [Kitasatospora camelliae]|uniref:Tetratricopeptide repeat protein n=1 Tax=Kitasatospora camelliae TaxID=3156397 RepID=A0AAU8K1P0_9ACTN
MAATHGHEHGQERGDGRPAAQGEVALARLALADGDLGHAASHLGSAIELDPELPEVHEALAELTVRSGGPAGALEHFPLDDPTVGAVACHAHLCAADGRWDQAIGLLAAVLREQPDRPWASVAWLGHPDLPALLDPESAQLAIARVVGGGLRDPLQPEVAEALRPFYRAMSDCVAASPDHPGLLTMASGLARRFGDPETAVGWARRAQRAAPSHTGAVMLGYALRSAGRPEETLEVWEEELARDPSDLSLHVDVGELYAQLGRPAEGLPWIERALAVEPLHPQAAPALHGVRYALDEDGGHLAALVDHLREHPEHGYASAVLAQCSERRPWLGHVAPAGESVVDAMHQVLEHEGAVAGECAVSALEAPSALRTFRAALPGSELTVRSNPEPDLREPLREVGLRVWRYEGLLARPAVEPPSAQAAALVRSVTELRWSHLLAAYDHAVALSSLSAEDLVGCLAFPPDPDGNEHGSLVAARWPDMWVRSVQVFACLGLTHHRTDQPWAGSDRRRLLHDLLFGPEDWVTEAAAVALVVVAWTDPAARQDAAELVAFRTLDAVKASRTRAVTVLGSLCRLTLAMPGLGPEVTGLAREVLAGMAGPEEPDGREKEARARPLPGGRPRRRWRWFGWLRRS